jgi:hypothetical protein
VSPAWGRAAALSLAALGLAPAASHAQDSQYWTLQYGPVAELLGGLVVGGPRDLSATFYNPGGLALAAEPSLLASVSSFQLMRIEAVSRPPVLDFSDTVARPSPSLFAVAVPRRWTGSHTVAVSALTRQDFDLRVDNWLLAPESGGGAESFLDQSLDEGWFGLSWAHRAGARLGLGLTTYLAHRGQRTRREVSGQAARSPDVGAAALLVEDFDFSSYRLLWKAGLSASLGSWDAGLAVTTASVGLFGSGSASYTRSAVGADIGGGRLVEVEVRHHDGLESRFRSPWSVAAGAAWRRGPHSLHGTVEWFGSVADHEVLDTRELANAPAAAGLRRRLQRSVHTVVNLGLGYRRSGGGRISYHGAFTTDFTSADKEESATSALSTWDIYHATAGASLAVGNATLTVGAAYAFGSDERQVSTVLVPDGGPPVLTPLPLHVRFSRVRVLVGVDFGG